MKSNLQRNEEAVSAAVATVLLFGGVISIIGLMMVSMIPVIEELEGSIERHDMSSQMSLLAHQTAALSETGMPGDSTEIELIPVDGQLKWNMMQSSMWYSATWAEDMSFRVKGALDYDDEMSIRHPESMNSAVCIDDLRLGPANPYIFTIPNWVEEVMMTASPGLALPLGPIKIEVWNEAGRMSQNELMVDGVLALETQSLENISIRSSHMLHVLYSQGNGGSALMTPNDPSPIDGTGRSWSIPLSSGTSQIFVISEKANQIVIADDSNTAYFALPSSQNQVGVSFSHQFQTSSDSVVHVTSSTDARLIVQSTTEQITGKMSWPSTDGNFLGHQFITPPLDGDMTFTNPGTESVTVTWRGGGLSVAGNQSIEFDWPPAGIEGAPMIDANGDITVTWQADLNGSGVFLHAADDTGASSGLQHTFHIQSNQSHTAEVFLAGANSDWNLSGDGSQNGTLIDSATMVTVNLSQGSSQLTVQNGHPLRIYQRVGSDGLVQAQHDGAQRCIPINVQASGWIVTELPWVSMSGRSEVDLKRAWTTGTHPASMQISLLGVNGASNYATLGTVWGFHLSRLSYEFSSSITGMEVAFAGGSVVTNHPEFEPYIVVAPADRGGPGPRFAATIPSLHPTTNSVEGAGSMNLDIELVDRSSLASAVAFEVRRGWSSPYGVAIADASADGLESSEDWTIYPGRIDLLSDYVGWVPDPSYATSEAVWHTNGQPIQFTLQMAALNAHMTESIS